MRLEWLKDLLAVLETDSLNAAAERRFVAQPAFSRRLKALEDLLGVSLIDRSSKPARPRAVLVEQHDRIQELTLGLHNLMHELKRNDGAAAEKIVIASQHALTTTLSPQLVKHVFARMPNRISLKSANYDECHAMLLARQAHLIVTYRLNSERDSKLRDYAQCLTLAKDQLVPVISRDAVAMIQAATLAGELPVVAYPPDVFLGHVFARELQPRLPGNPFIRRQAETALTLAALQMALAGIGVAWLPRTLAIGDIQSGKLVSLHDMLPQCDLEIVASRLTHTATVAESAVWEALGTLQVT